MVFKFSSANGNESTGISMKAANFLVEKKEYIKNVEQIIRKLAHLSEYAIGAVLVYLLLRTYKINSKMQFVGAGTFTLLYAITDEIHQCFVPGRAGMLIDVWIDFIGIMLGLCGMLLMIKILQINKEKRSFMKS